METRGGARGRVGAGFTLIELSGVVAIIGVLVGFLLPAVQKIETAAGNLPKKSAVKAPLIDWGDKTAKLREDTADFLLSMNGIATATGNAPKWQDVLNDVEASDATARDLLPQVQSALKQVRGPERERLQRIEAGLMEWETGVTEFETAIKSVSNGIP